MKINKSLISIHLNEFNLNFLKYGAKKYKCENIKKYLKLNKVKTYSIDKIQDKDLDPWVQSVSINLGKNSKKHKTFKIGQNVKIKFVKDRPGHDVRYALNSKKIMTKLKWKSRIDFKKGLEKTFLWYLNNTNYYKSLSINDIEKRIGKLND